MSPSWRDEIGAYLAADRVLLVRAGRGLHRPPLAETCCPIVPPAADWPTAIETLSEQLARPEWGRAAVRVVVADRWVRYAVVPWSDALGSAEEQSAHARELLLGRFGEALADWRLSVADAPPGQARLACALPAALLDGLRAAVDGQGRRLASVQAQLIAGYNDWRHRFAGGATAWFVSVEDGTLTALRTDARGVSRVHAVRVDADWARELRRLQTMSRVAAGGADPDRMYVDVPLALRGLLGTSPATWEWLEPDEAPGTTMHRLGCLRRKTA